MQIGDTAFIEFAEKLIPDGPMPALKFTLARWRKWPTVDQMDTQAHADPLQRAGAVSGTIVDDQFDWEPSAQQRLLEHSFDILRRFAQAELTVRGQARGIVEE